LACKLNCVNGADVRDQVPPLRRSQELQDRVNKDDVAPRSVHPIDGAATLEKEITSNAIFAGDIPLDMRHAYSASNRKGVFPKECSVGDGAVHLAHQSRLNGDDDLADLDVRLNIAVGIDDLNEREGPADVKLG
jgi:hypothetical protein